MKTAILIFEKKLEIIKAINSLKEVSLDKYAILKDLHFVILDCLLWNYFVCFVILMEKNMNVINLCICNTSINT